MNLLREIGPIVIAAFVAFGLAVWFSVVVWTFIDIRSRSSDKFVWFFAVLLVLLFNVFGLVDLSWSVYPYCTTERKVPVALPTISPQGASPIEDRTEERPLPAPRAL